MHLAWEISAGQIVISMPLLALALYAFRSYNMLLMFRIEHELLMRDWADKQTPPKKLHELPWRQKRWW